MSASTSRQNGKSRQQQEHDDAKSQQQRKFRSGIFRFFAVCALIVSVLNIAYHEAYHDEDIAKMASDVFRRSHFRTNVDLASALKRENENKNENNDAAVDQQVQVVSGDAAEDAAKPKTLTSELAGLRCDDHGGPSDPSLAAEMVYWDDVPSDSEWVSPFHPMHAAGEDGQYEEKYLTFEPDK